MLLGLPRNKNVSLTPFESLDLPNDMISLFKYLVNVYLYVSENLTYLPCIEKESDFGIVIIGF